MQATYQRLVNSTKIYKLRIKDLAAGRVPKSFDISKALVFRIEKFKPMLRGRRIVF